MTADQARTDPWQPALRPYDRAPDRAAILCGATELNYRQVAAAIQAIDTGARRIDAAGLSMAEQLIAVFAAAAARIPVWIADPALPLPAGWTDRKLPVGAFLVVGTSGSSATPKAVVRTASSWTASLPAYTELTGVGPGDRLLLTGPLFSTLQLFAAVHALAVGATVTDDPSAADTAVCVPAVLPRLLTADSTLRSVVVAGASLPEPVAQQALSAGLEVIEYYGAAELSFVAGRRRPAPLRAFPGVELQVRGGELWSRSPFQAQGYLSSAGLTPLHRDPHGFVTVGDLGSVDADGRVRVHGRGEEAVTIGGRTVLVEDIEAALATVRSLRDAAVIGLPHPRLGQQLVALVVPAAGSDVPTIRAAAHAVLSGEALPRRWLPVSRIPRRPNGKIDRAAVRRLAGERSAPLPPMTSNSGADGVPSAPLLRGTEGCGQSGVSRPHEVARKRTSMPTGPVADSVPTIRTRVAGAPISWGVCEVPGWGFQLPVDRVLGQMRDVGLAATEFGPEGFLPAAPSAKSAALQGYGLAAVGQFVPAVLHDPDHDPLPGVRQAMAALVAAQASTVVLAAATGVDGYNSRPELTSAGWATLLAQLDRIAAAAVEHGLVATLHPHVGTMIESGDETLRVLDGSGIGLCLDTGHLLIGGGDPVAIARAHPERIAHVHLKDVRLARAQQVRAGSLSYTDAVGDGLYAPLGGGDVDVAAIVTALESHGYAGWYVLEQDTILTGDPDSDPNVTDPLDDVRTSMAYIDTVADRLDRGTGQLGTEAARDH